MSVCYYVGCGIVFELTKDTEGNWNEKILHEMTGSDGSYTVGPVVFDSAGNLMPRQFGATTAWDQSSNSRPPQRTMEETMLHLFDYQFPNGKDGESPYAGVIFDRGRVFGTPPARRILQFGHGFRNHAARECSSCARHQ